MKRINLSDQVFDVIKTRIVNGTYRNDSYLPTIADLATELGVGRSTIREALSRLENAGMIEVRHGKGIYVTEPGVEYSSQVQSFTETVIELGMVPGTEVIQKSEVWTDESLADKLHVAVGEPLNMLVRLRLADGKPMALERSYTPCQLFPGLCEQPGLDGSLYGVLQNMYHVNIAFATRVIKAVLTRPAENKLLGLSGRQPALQIETLAQDSNHRPIEYGISLYRADRFHFIVQQTRRK
jgi:GntR family transcriptional regulator